MPEYRKKPVVIEARQLLGNASEIVSWIVEHGGNASYQLDDNGSVFIRTLEGTMEAQQGDFVIKGVHGEFYPCKPDIFEATYDAVEPAPVVGGNQLIAQFELALPGYQPLNGKVEWLKNQFVQPEAVRVESHVLLDDLFDALEKA